MDLNRYLGPKCCWTEGMLLSQPAGSTNFSSKLEYLLSVAVGGFSVDLKSHSMSAKLKC